MSKENEEKKNWFANCCFNIQSYYLWAGIKNTFGSQFIQLFTYDLSFAKKQNLPIWRANTQRRTERKKFEKPKVMLWHNTILFGQTKMRLPTNSEEWPEKEEEEEEATVSMQTSTWWWCDANKQCAQHQIRKWVRPAQILTRARQRFKREKEWKICVLSNRTWCCWICCFFLLVLCSFVYLVRFPSPFNVKWVTKKTV